MLCSRHGWPLTYHCHYGQNAWRISDFSFKLSEDFIKALLTGIYELNKPVYNKNIKRTVMKITISDMVPHENCNNGIALFAELQLKSSDKDFSEKTPSIHL